MADKEWTVEDTREAVKRLKTVVEPPSWANVETVAASVVTGEAEPDLGDSAGSRNGDGAETSSCRCRHMFHLPPMLAMERSLRL